MSHIIQAEHYDALTKLRGHVYQAISDKDVPEMYRRIGMVQGYLAGLHSAGEIDVSDVQSLEQETLDNVYFRLNTINARKAH